MSAVPAPAPEYRALLVYDHLPPGCLAHPVADNRFAPHLRSGEWAVVDTQDREPVQGEVYVVRISSPLSPQGYRLRVVQIWGRQYNFCVADAAGVMRPDPGHGWMMHFQIRQHFGPMTHEQVCDALAAGTMGLCDGPLRTEAMRDKIVGRVVGLLAPAFEEPRRIAVDLVPIAPARPRRARPAQPPRRRQA